MEAIEIRRAAGQDADALTGLMHASRAYRRGMYVTALAGYRITADYIVRRQVFAAVDSTGQVVGFYAYAFGFPQVVELQWLFVADALQGRGIGTRLIRHALARARAAGYAGVGVIAHPPAEGFFARLGGARTGEVPAVPPHIRWERTRFMLPTDDE
ncbi:GNAT family N-acetyltransferase [Streptomyces sp. S1A]|uniref:GNAT family N-acetyltransferase n=1 Tax=Streptomyces sp. ICN903 TaxID=2964654 RepID=UPI001EDA0A60|nr:GNAT family N-acetyltransferase [Streptomyces sp. ICN903]MCG3040040.1 GNAT family N-acetyltransferase [Streptomyces sp. ICN903]